MLLGTIIAGITLFYLLITVHTSGGKAVKSDWPKVFTEQFKDQIIFTNHKAQVKQMGIEQLQENEIGLQVLDSSGHELFSYQTPKQANTSYSSTELLHLYQTGELKNSDTTSFIGTVNDDGNDYAYVLYFPIKVSKITMYLNGDRFTGGKTIFFFVVGVLFIVVLVSGMMYGFWTTRMINKLTTSIKEIASRSYVPIQAGGAFQNIYDSLNTMDTEIRASDLLQAQTQKMREEWISNITHDLKTPLSPIKGYAELLQEHGATTKQQGDQYARVMLKNVAYMETLIDDLKLTYQLEGGMLPLKRQEHNIVRFLKELVIDILNHPEYEQRKIHFGTTQDTILFTFDQTLMKRGIQNLIINALVHGGEDTEVSLQVFLFDSILQIVVFDNGKGMTAEEVKMLFQRYYRGTNTEHKSEGTGLGLAIVKSIVEQQGGSISVSSIVDVGTTFLIQFPMN